jgi:hypothetical protein
MRSLDILHLQSSHPETVHDTHAKQLDPKYSNDMQAIILSLTQTIPTSWQQQSQFVLHRTSWL